MSTLLTIDNSISGSTSLSMLTGLDLPANDIGFVGDTGLSFGQTAALFDPASGSLQGNAGLTMVQNGTLLENPLSGSTSCDFSTLFLPAFGLESQLSGTVSLSFGHSVDLIQSPGYGNSWNYQYSTKNAQYRRICCSSSGQKVYSASRINSAQYTSTDYGQTWITPSWIAIGGAPPWLEVCCSSTMSLIAAVRIWQNSGGSPHDDYVWTSSDQGLTWNKRTDSGYRAWAGIACSASGTKIFATTTSASGVGSDGYIYVSTDSGANWNARATRRTWGSICCSSDGTTVYATDGNTVWKSTNSGTSWTQLTLSGLSPAYSLVKCSGTGAYVYVIGASTQPWGTPSANRGFLRSTNGGSSWTLKTFNPRVGCMAVSETGQVVVATNMDIDGLPRLGQVYISRDYGVTFTAAPGLGQLYFTEIAISSDGFYIYLTNENTLYGGAFISSP